MDAKIYAKVAIQTLGGTDKAARFFNVTSSAVAQWRTKGFPPARSQTLRYARPKIHKAAMAAAESERK